MFGVGGLAGELRNVSGIERRDSESARQGFNIALIPAGSDTKSGVVPPGMRALTAPTIVAALQHMLNIADHRSAAPPRPHRLDA
jgi:DNA repair protein RadA/Sms